MTDVICPLCGKPNPPNLDECQYCQAPLKTRGFIAPSEGEGDKASIPPFSEDITPSEEQSATSGTGSSPEQSIPDWLKETEASFTGEPEPTTGEPGAGQLSEEIESLINPPSAPAETPGNAIDDDWLTSLLVEAGAVETPQAETPQAETPAETPEGQEPGSPGEEPGSGIEEENEQPALPTPLSEKPDWLTTLEASSKIKFEGEIFASEPEQAQPIPAEVPEEKAPEPEEPPEWLTKAVTGGPVDESKGAEEPEEVTQRNEPPTETPKGAEAPIAPAELPGWLEALRPSETIKPTGPVEDVSGADVVTAGPLMGLRAVISSNPAAIRPQKPPTYSIKLKVTDEQQDRLRMMEELLADEGKPKPLPTKSAITSRNILRLIVAIVLLLPMIWMIISNKQQTTYPQPGSVPGVIDFTQSIQALPANAPVLLAFDYEAGFSGELNIAITNAVSQLMKKNAYLTIASTNPSGPALAESVVKSTGSALSGSHQTYSNYANLGYIPGGTMGLLGLASSPRSILPYTLDDRNVWAKAPLDKVSAISDFSAVIVITNDPDTARMWIEQVGTQLQKSSTPLLFITSAQAEPLIRPYYQATPSMVQGMIAGLTGGVAYARTVGNYQPMGVWDAYSAGITISILIILIGSIAGVVIKMLAPGKKKET